MKKKGANCLPKINSHEIFQVTEVEFFKVSKTVLLSDQQDQENQQIELLKELLQSLQFYYSFSYNLSQSMQR